MNTLQLEQDHQEANKRVNLAKRTISHIEELADVHPSFSPIVLIAVNEIKNDIDNTVERLNVEVT